MGAESTFGQGIVIIMKTVILAFSGGLDTSFAVIYLKKQGYKVITVTVNTGGFTKKQLEDIKKRAASLGANKHYTVSCENEFFDKIIGNVIRANALYEGKYPLLCADRYIIAEKVVGIAQKENAEAIAHGSTAMGNDQIRFDSAFVSLAPELKILSPIKETNFSREKEVAYLAENGYSVPLISKKYSINENSMGITISGSEIDLYEEPKIESYKLTNQKPEAKSEYLKLYFKNGYPKKLNGISLTGTRIIQKLNQLVGSYGWGSDIYTGNCIIGIKGRIRFEAPGLLALIKAHQALEQLVLTKAQIDVNSVMRMYYSNHLYNGLYFDPIVKDIEGYFDINQRNVEGEVVLKLSPFNLTVASVKSPNTLVNKKIANYAQSCTWTKNDADGFIKLFTLQEKLANLKK